MRVLFKRGWLYCAEDHFRAPKPKFVSFPPAVQTVSEHFQHLTEEIPFLNKMNE